MYFKWFHSMYDFVTFTCGINDHLLTTGCLTEKIQFIELDSR